MGKARILSAQGEGRYTIEILEDRTRAESLKTMAQQRITQIDSQLTDLEQDLAAAQQAVDAAAAAQDQAIADYQQAITDGEQPSQQVLTEAAQDVIEAAQQRDAVRTQIAALNLERLQQQGWIDRVDALPPLRTQDAWCADYTEDLDGEVATAEVPGEIGQVIIKPGLEDAAAWSPSLDGAIQPALAGTPASVFYNLAMMPGWQKWRPTFRTATISNIDNDLCDITLDAATSSQQGLSVNSQSSYSGVPIYYMDCNGGAFEDGDRVLVAFSGNTDQPMVVGFAEEPKPCDAPTILIPIDISMAAYSDAQNFSLSERFDDVPAGSGDWAYYGLYQTSFDAVIRYDQARLFPVADYTAVRNALTEGDLPESWSSINLGEADTIRIHADNPNVNTTKSWSDGSSSGGAAYLVPIGVKGVLSETNWSGVEPLDSPTGKAMQIIVYKHLEYGRYRIAKSEVGPDDFPLLGRWPEYSYIDTSMVKKDSEREALSITSFTPKAISVDVDGKTYANFTQLRPVEGIGAVTIETLLWSFADTVKIEGHFFYKMALRA